MDGIVSQLSSIFDEQRKILCRAIWQADSSRPKEEIGLMGRIYYTKIIEYEVEKMRDSGGAINILGAPSHDILLAINAKFTGILVNIDMDASIHKEKDYHIAKMMLNWYYGDRKSSFDVSSDVVSPLDLVSKPSWVLNPKFRENIDMDIKIRSEQKIEKKITTMYRCPREGCGARRATTRLVQTRSSDEDNTLFVTCLECDNTWTVNK